MTQVYAPFNVKLLQLTDQATRNLRPITTQDTFDGATKNFHPNGLFSNEIFGHNGEKSRMRNFAYIDIKIPILHPMIYRTLGKLKRIYPEIMAGRTWAIFDEQEQDFVKSDQVNGRTGYTFFMEYWEKIVFPQRLSDLRALSIKLIERTKKVALNTRIIVAPAGFRDYVIIDNREEEDEVNSIYRRLLQASNNVSKDMFDLNPVMFDRVRYGMQHAFNALYEYYENIIRGKNKLLQGHVMTRQVRDGTRNVITTQNLDVKELFAPGTPTTNSTGIGLFQFIKAYRPKCVYQIQQGYLRQVFRSPGAPARLVNPRSLRAEEVQLPLEEYDRWMPNEGIEKMFNLFGEEERRHEPLMVAGYYLALIYNDGKVFKLLSSIDDLPEGFDRKHVKPITFAEFIYSQVYTIEDEVTINITRFPVTGFGSIYPSEPFLKVTMTTQALMPLSEGWRIESDSVLAREFPIRGEPFINTLMPAPDKLKGLTADFDGDKATGNGVYTQEAVAESKAVMRSRNFHVRNDGSIAHSLNTDTVEFLFGSMTSKPVVTPELLAKYGGQMATATESHQVTPVVKVDTSKLNQKLIAELRKYPELLKALHSFTQLADRTHLPKLKQLVSIVQEYHPKPSQLTVFRGFDCSRPIQEKMGITTPRVGDVVGFQSDTKVLSTTTDQNIASAFGNAVVQIELTRNHDYLVVTDELYFLIAEINGSKSVESQKEVIVLPPFNLKMRVVDVDTSFLAKIGLSGLSKSRAAKEDLKEDLTGIPVGEAYQEQASIFHSEGKNYDLNKLFELIEAQGVKVRQVPVNKLDWVLTFDTPDPARVEDADIRIPIIATPFKGGVYLPVDGLHRVARANEEGVTRLPAYVITRAQLEQALIT